MVDKLEKQTKKDKEKKKARKKSLTNLKRSDIVII